jgi:nitrite reductase/ring-hydroxylating ferredoxin subunit
MVNNPRQDDEVREQDEPVPASTSGLPDEAESRWATVPMPQWDPDYPIVAAEVGDVTIALARIGGEVYAFADECTHQKCSLSDGDVDEEAYAVVCPCHNGVFDVRTGAVLDGPPPEPIATYACRVDGADLRIAIPYVV